MDRDRQQSSESVTRHDLRHVGELQRLWQQALLFDGQGVAGRQAHRLDHASATSRPRLEAEQHRPAATRRSLRRSVDDRGPVPGEEGPVLRYAHGGFLDRWGSDLAWAAGHLKYDPDPTLPWTWLLQHHVQGRHRDHLRGW